VVSQDVSRRTLSTGFASAEDDPRGAEHRNKESIATLSPYRTMRDGAVTAFLASNSVHGDLLAHVIARANAIDNSLSMVRAAGSQQGNMPFKTQLRSHGNLSSRTFENSAPLSGQLRSRRDID
jgi:hypothetical protein